MPPTLIESVLFLAVLTSVMMAVEAPVTVGLKITGNLTLDLGAICTGKGNVPSEKALPCSESESIFSVLRPVLESWTE